MTTTGVLVMAYGSPRTIDEVEPYLRDIRGGRPVSAEAVAELRSRYERVGVPSPLEQITHRQAAALTEMLGDDYRVVVGMKHWHPTIADAVERLASLQHVVGLALAPHYSRISIGGYADRIVAARERIGAGFRLTMIEHWYEQPAFVDLVAANLRAIAAQNAHVFFTAHSLPERILAEGDPYRDQLLASAKLIADAAGVQSWELAFQSASATGEPWLGPDILEALEDFAKTGRQRVVIAPIGFVSDHLEILFDVDVECVEAAERLGLDLRRIASPNDDPRLIRALAEAVVAAEASIRR